MDKGPDYERIRAMLGGKVVPAEEQEEQSWIGRYLRLAEQFISGPFKPRARLFDFPRSSNTERTSQPAAAAPDGKKEEEAA
jgi:hypothetical protein